jgi:hypothetical protein
MKILPKFDSRRLSFHEYGQVAGFEDTYIVDTPIVDRIQPTSDVRCVLFSLIDIVEDKMKKKYDLEELTSRIKIGKNGTDPMVVVKEVIKNGLLPLGGTVREFPFSSYFTAHTGDMDAFNNTRSAIVLAKYPILVWGPWYSTFLSGIVEKGTDFFNIYHCTDSEGWAKMSLITVGDEPIIQIEAHVGRKLYFTRDVFNWWAKKYGFDTLVLSDIRIDAVRKKLLKEKINDLYVNVVILANQLIAQLLEQISKKKLQ